jgi:hypothetical protein
MALKVQDRSGLLGSDSPSLAGGVSAESESALVSESFEPSSTGRASISTHSARPERLWYSGAEKASTPLIADDFILQVNFSGHQLDTRSSAAISGVGIPFGLTADNKYVLMQGSEHSSICTAEAMLLLDVIGKYQLDPDRLRPNLVWVKNGIDACFETVADSLSRNLRGTGVEIDYQKFDISETAGSATRSDTVLRIMEKLVDDQGTLMLAPDSQRQGQVVLVDAVDQEGPIPLVRLREPAHGWQITVLGHEFASAIGDRFEAIQAYRPTLGPISEIVDDASRIGPEKCPPQPICVHSRYIERHTGVGLGEIRPGDIFITSLNGTQRMVLAEEPAGDDGRSFTVLVKRQNESIVMQSATLTEHSMAAVLQVVRSRNASRTQIAGLLPAQLEQQEIRIDPVLLVNKPVIIGNAETLIGLGPEGLTLNRKTRHTTHGTTSVISVDAMVDLDTGALDLYNHSRIAAGLIPLKLEYSMTAGLKETLPTIRITPLGSGLNPELSYDLSCALSIASRFLFAAPELPPNPADEFAVPQYNVPARAKLS